MGALASCTSGSDTETGDEGTSPSTDATASVVTDGRTESGAQAATDKSYSVEMAPVGEVTFEAVPKTWVRKNCS
jgi:iron complex transport system substrate-binding protein